MDETKGDAHASGVSRYMHDGKMLVLIFTLSFFFQKCFGYVKYSSWQLSIKLKNVREYGYHFTYCSNTSYPYVSRLSIKDDVEIIHQVFARMIIIK